MTILAFLKKLSNMLHANACMHALPLFKMSFCVFQLKQTIRAVCKIPYTLVVIFQVQC